MEDIFYNKEMERKEKKGPLKGVRIIDMTRLLPGPLATQLLADMGADVIKVEDPKAPDYARFMAPHYNNIGLTYLSINRSKRSLALNLSSEQGKTIFWELLQTADIVIDSFRPGVLEKLGLDYQSALKHKEDIIYVSVTGYGHGNEKSQKAGHDINYLGYSGVLSMMGKKEEIVQPGVQISDIAGGSYPTVIACLSALVSKATTGKGQFVDVAMVDCSMPFMTFYLADALNTHKVYQRQEHPLAGSLPNYNIYRCKDAKWVALGALEPKFWKGFCEHFQHPEWFNRMFDDKMKGELQVFFETKDRDEWIRLSGEADICLTPILEIDELDQDKYLNDRNLFIENTHSKYGTYKGINQPIKFNASQEFESWAPPLMGEDNTQILRELNYTKEEIVELYKNGILTQEK